MTATYPFARIAEALETSEQLEARVVKTYARGTLVSLGGNLALLKRDDATASRYEVEDKFFVQVLEVDEQTRKVFVTNKNISGRQVRHDNFDRAILKIEIGRKYKVRITGIAANGLFVDVNGIDGLVPIREVTWLQIPTGGLRTHFKIGQTVDVIVKTIDTNEKKVRLSIRETTTDPFLSAYEMFQKNGDKIFYGQVKNVVDYGVFVKIADGVDGLLHASKLQAVWNIQATTAERKTLSEQTKSLLRKLLIIPVKVFEVDKRRRRISLEYAGEPVDLNKAERWPPVGKQLSGRVSAVNSYRIRIDIDSMDNCFVYEEDDITGFIELGLQNSLGDIVQVQVLGFDVIAATMRLKYIPDIVQESDEVNYLLENFFAGRSELDLGRRLDIPNPYLILARQLLHFKGQRLNKTFDYIYHFGHISGEDAIRLFGLLHRASIEFKLHRPELGLALLKSALRDAIRLRRKWLIDAIFGVISKQSEIIWPDEISN